MKIQATFPALALLALASQAAAQEAFGLWEDTPSTYTFEFYVSAFNGSDSNPGTITQPYRTITAAMVLADQLVPFYPVTVNVSPGLYDDQGPNAEAYPISLPAFGFSLETWPQPGSFATPASRPVLDGASFSTALDVDTIGNPSLPPTVIQGLEILNAAAGIVIDPTIGTLSDVDTFAVEIRDNFLHDMSQPLIIRTATNTRSAHVVEHNVIGDESVIVGRGVFIDTSGESSTLVRSNVIQRFEDNLFVAGSGKGTRPRIFSNFIQVAERNVQLQNCDPFVVNNTIAYAINFTSVPQVDGLIWNGGTMVLSNNILWNPVQGSLAPIARDLTVTGAVLATTNLIEDAPMGMTPGFVNAGGVLGDNHPGFPGRDLHLAGTSAMIAAGTNGTVAAPATTAIISSFGATPMRVDVNMDIDLDARVYQSVGDVGPITVDIGGDEFKTLTPAGTPASRIELVNPFGATPGTQDAFGNVTPFAPSNYTVILYLTGPPNGVFSVMSGVLFDMMQGGAPNGPNYQNLLVTAPPAGNALISLQGGYSPTLVNGFFDGAGQGTATLLLSNVASGNLEGEFHLQAITGDLVTGRVATSNRTKIELN